MRGSEFDEIEFFRAIVKSGARALLIGRRALVALGVPVLTADYDCWLHIDDCALFNEAIEPGGLVPTRTPEDARTRGRYVLENDERVDGLAPGGVVRPAVAPSAETVARLRALADRILDAEEFRSLRAVPLGAAELGEARSLIRWFRRRYPTPAERLAHARRGYRRWARLQQVFEP